MKSSRVYARVEAASSKRQTPLNYSLTSFLSSKGNGKRFENNRKRGFGFKPSIKQIPAK